MKTKFKFVQTTGCTAFNFTVNDECIADLSEKKQEEIVDYLLVKLKERFKEKNILLENIVEMFHYDDYEHDPEQCDQCGDTVSTTTWNI
jgi:hypothetical protein